MKKLFNKTKLFSKVKSINAQSVIAVCALVIGLCTVIVYIYQANIMAKQHQDSVWPYAFTGYSLNSDEGYSIRVTNKGIGPALVKSVSIELDDKQHLSWKGLMKSIGLDSINYTCSGVGVLSPNEVQTIFQVKKFSHAKIVWEKLQNLKIKITYCSIHDECWKVDSYSRKKTKSSENSTVTCG